MKQGNNMRHVRICRSEYLLLNRVVRPNSVRSFMLSPDIMFIILFIAFDASLFLKNELISDRKFVSLTLSIGFVTVIFYFLKLLIFCYLQKYPMLFLHHFFKKYNLRNLNNLFNKMVFNFFHRLLRIMTTNITEKRLEITKYISIIKKRLKHSISL